MKLFVLPNVFTNNQIDIARKSISDLSCAEGVEVSTTTDVSLKLSGDNSLNKFDVSSADYIVSIGGDGSVLRAAKVSVDENIPLIGINAGRLGYLSSLEVGEEKEILDIIKTLSFNERTLISYELPCANGYSVNDCVIAKDYFGEAVNLKLTVDGNEFYTFRGDGIIISTPTGSSAYNLSSGGPLVDTRLDLFVVTPICPHSKSITPIVISSKSVLEVTRINGDVSLYSDGTKICSVDDRVTFTSSSKKLRLAINEKHIVNLNKIK